MAGPFSAQCPSCDARLKIQNPAAVGKKVRCPNCQNPFTIKPPRSAAPQDEFEPEDDFDDYEDYGGGRDDLTIGRLKNPGPSSAVRARAG